MSTQLRILGFDPGIATVGYGIIDNFGKVNKTVDYGVITTSKNLQTCERLALIYNSAQQIITKYQPQAIALEELFFYTNVTTAMRVSEARGVLVLASVQFLGNIYEYTPIEVKMAMTGYGRADKKQIQLMVKSFLSLEGIPKPDDAADALAIALTHAQSYKIASISK